MSGSSRRISPKLNPARPHVSKSSKQRKKTRGFDCKKLGFVNRFVSRRTLPGGETPSFFCYHPLIGSRRRLGSHPNRHWVRGRKTCGHVNGPSQDTQHSLTVTPKRILIDLQPTQRACLGLWPHFPELGSNSSPGQSGCLCSTSSWEVRLSGELEPL